MRSLPALGSGLAWLLLCAQPGAAAPPNDFSETFNGVWHCGSERWTFSAFGPDWTRVEYAHGSVIDGVAYVGYVAQLGKYVYRDFHADGSYAELSSAPPAANAWTWAGIYYPVGTTGTLDAVITYSVVDATHFARSFSKRERDGSLSPQGGDACAKDDEQRR